MKHKRTIMGIYPNARGYGYALLSSPHELLDYGSVCIAPVSNKEALLRINRLIERLQPTAMVLPLPSGRWCRIGNRSKKLVEELSSTLLSQGVPVYQYNRDRIREVFEVFKSKTKDEIAKTITDNFPELFVRLPEPRKMWQAEDFNMAIFDAVSLVMAHYYLSE